MATSMILVGYRGSGKTTVARLLSRRLGCAAFDTDDEIVAGTGMPISRIFATEGEEGFRERERERLLAALRREPPWILATGGGSSNARTIAAISLPIPRRWSTCGCRSPNCAAGCAPTPANGRP